MNLSTAERRMFLVALGERLEWPDSQSRAGNPVSSLGAAHLLRSDVDAFCAYLKEKGLRPEAPQDASWGERYFHMSDRRTCAFVCSSDSSGLR